MLWLRNVATEATVKKQELLSWIVIRLSLPMLWHCLLDYCFQDEKCLVQADLSTVVWYDKNSTRNSGITRIRGSWRQKQRISPKKEGTPRNFMAGLIGTPRLLCLGAVAPSSPLSYAIAQKQKSECIQLLYMLSLHKAETIWTENVKRTEKTNGTERVKIMSLVGHSDYK